MCSRISCDDASIIVSVLIPPLTKFNSDFKFTTKTWLKWFMIPYTSPAPPCTLRWIENPQTLGISETALFVIRKRDFNFTLLSAQTQWHRFKTFTVNSAVSGETHSRSSTQVLTITQSERPGGESKPRDTSALSGSLWRERDRRHVFCIGWVFTTRSHARRCTALFMAAVIELTDVIFHRPVCGNETASRAEGDTVILCRSMNRGNGNEDSL